ncbi:hypothetical protein AgCh_016764 [Apium graveolens]
MLLFIKMVNPLYVQILKNGPFTRMVRVEESIDGDMVIPAHFAPKDPAEYSDPEKEKVSLESSLRLILIESLDNVMYNNIVNCDTDKKIWEKIEILCEGTEEIRSNQRRILISQYEGFMAKPKESITEVFESFNKMINYLHRHEKYYKGEEVNLEFLITLPDHLEHKISAIGEGRDLSRVTLEVLYGILKTYELEMIQRQSLRSGQGHVVDGSSALIVNEGQIFNDEPRSHISVASTSEQRTIDSQEQVILELEKDEYYTLKELDELNQSMAYLARKFSNIRVKKPRSNIRYFSCDELGHFATEYRKPKKVKKDKAYLELEAKYEALLKKQQSKAYIAEGESSSSKSQVQTLTSTDLNVNQYKEIVEKMSTTMFHIQTSMVVANEEVRRLTKLNEKLESEKQEAELLTVELEALKQENGYLKNKLNCANEIEVVLREKLEKSEVKLKSFKNGSELVGQYHEKNKLCANIAIGLDYNTLNSKKKNTDDRGKATKSENVPAMLKNVGSPVFKTCEVNFSEEELIIKQEIVDEDNEKKNANSIQSSKAEENLMDNQSTKTPIKETRIEDARKKKKNRSGRMGKNKSNNLAYVVDIPGKKCGICNSTNYLTHLCKKGVSKPTEGTCKYNEADLDDPYSFCDKFNCIPCNLKVMKNCHKLRVDLKETQIESTSERKNAQQSLNSIF